MQRSYMVSNLMYSRANRSTMKVMRLGSLGFHIGISLSLVQDPLFSQLPQRFLILFPALNVAVPSYNYYAVHKNAGPRFRIPRRSIFSADLSHRTNYSWSCDANHALICGNYNVTTINELVMI